MAWNSPFAERNSSQRSISRPFTAVARNLSSKLESEAEVIEMESYHQEPSETTHNNSNNTQSVLVVEARSIDMPQAMAASNKTLTLCSKHDYEEVMLNALAKEGSRFNTLTRDHVYDEPDEMEPGINLTEARGYEEPVTRNWKRLSLPSLDNPSLMAIVSQQMQRRNSSASELHSSGSFKPQAANPGRILHYAEFSLYPNTQSGALSSVSEVTVGTPSPHKTLSSRPSREPHDYEEPSFPAGNLRQAPCPIPAPTRLLRGGSVSDYEIPVTTFPPLLRTKSSQSVMRQVKLKLHHLSASMSSGGNINDEEVQLIESESEGRDESSDVLKSPGNEAFSSQDTNSSNNVSS